MLSLLSVSTSSRSLLPVLLFVGATLLYGCSKGSDQASETEAGSETESPEAVYQYERDSTLGTLPSPGDPLFDNIIYLRSLPHGGGVSGAIGDYWMRQGAPDSALAYYEDALEHDPNDANRINSVGLAYKQVGRLADAKKSFIRAVDVDADNVHGYVNLGNVYFADEEYEKAKAQYMLATLIDSTNINALYNYAVILDKLGDTKAGIRALYRAINQYPNDPQLREKLGDYFMNVSAYKRAVEQYTEALGRDPSRNHLRERIEHLMDYMQEHGMLKEN